MRSTILSTDIVSTLCLFRNGHGAGELEGIKITSKFSKSSGHCLRAETRTLTACRYESRRPAAWRSSHQHSDSFILPSLVLLRMSSSTLDLYSRSIAFIRLSQCWETSPGSAQKRQHRRSTYKSYYPTLHCLRRTVVLVIFQVSRVWTSL